MGCDKFRDGGLGIGGVRASMERRWLINAKSTMMRQKKWQEVKMQKEQEESKKVAEILEKRKRERARLAAYIHMQPVKCTANAPRCSRFGNKRSNWNTCLLEDQEIIMRFREKSAVVHNGYYHKANLAADTVWQGDQKVHPLGAYTNSYMKGYHVPGQNFVMNTRYMEDAAYESYNNPEKYHSDMDQMSEVSAAKCSSKSEPMRHTTWVPEADRAYACLAEERRRQPAAKPKSLGSNAHENEDEPAVATQSVHAQGKKKRNSTISDLTESYAEAFGVTSNSAALREDEFASEEPTCDLREEILKARQANEAATARLIAEANAIESRLEDCNLSLKPLDFREAEQDGITKDVDRYTSDTDPLCCDSLGETDSNFSSESDEITSGLFSKRTVDSHDKPQCKQVIQQTAVAPTSALRPFSDLYWNTLTVGSPETSHNMSMVNAVPECKGQENVKPDEDQASLWTSKERVAVASPSPKPSSDDEGNFDTVGSSKYYKKVEPLGFQATREAYTHHKRDNEVNSAAIREDKFETNGSIKKDSSVVWNIDWDTPIERLPGMKMDCSQSNQQISPSRMPRRGERKVPTNQNSIQQRLTEDTGSLREERKKIESCSGRPPTIPEGGGNMFRTKVDMPPLPLHHLNSGFSQHLYRGYKQMQSLHPGYPHEENTMQEAPRGPMVRNDCTGDKGNYRRVHSGALTEEEEKIFASLERLDWKLAALQSRSASTGRASFASQGEFSTKSAPAVMGPPTKKLGLAGLHCVKKPLPYSAVPPRPLTPPSQRPPTGLRRRRQVGLTNKCAGKASHCCPRYPAGASNDNAGHPDVGSEKCFSSGTIVCHQSAHKLFDAAAAC